jgi:hypothetical protein
MLEALPIDVLVLVCRGLSQFDVERLLATCAPLRAHAREDFFQALAVERWGAAFWHTARTRRTRHVFVSFRAELRRMACFDRTVVRAGGEPWGVAEYAAWWRYESECLAALQGRRRREWWPCSSVPPSARRSVSSSA